MNTTSFFLVIRTITIEYSFNVINLRRIVKTTEDTESTEDSIFFLCALCVLCGKKLVWFELTASCSRQEQYFFYPGERLYFFSMQPIISYETNL